MGQSVNHITPQGYKRLSDEYQMLYGQERPRLLETISWAAGNGDRSENGDYIYGRKRLREVDRRINRLSRRMAEALVIDPSEQPDRDHIWFGATVTLLDEDDVQRTITLVGEDESDASAGQISWNSPIGRAIRGAATGDLRMVSLPGGAKEVEVVSITYPGSRQ